MHQSTNFSSGPCAKRNGWTPPSSDLLGRSHRSHDGMVKIKQLIDLTRQILQIPDNYFIGILGGSDTGAMETLLWTLLGARGIDALANCNFGKAWTYDIQNELQLTDVQVFTSNFPDLCNTSDVNPEHDLVFCWTSTTSGASFHDANWISDHRKGLTICDATSAVFACDLQWSKLDATAFSWQKALGGEAGLGTIVLSPRAIERLESYKPSWPIPRLFRIATNKKVNFNIFEGCTINTPSMMIVEDFYEALVWAKTIGGLKALLRKVENNYTTVKHWISQQNLFQFLVNEEHRAHHIACFDINDTRYQNLSTSEKWNFLRKIVDVCEAENTGHDFLGHISTEPHLRIWIGPTIEADDLKIFLPHMDTACRSVLRDTFC